MSAIKNPDGTTTNTLSDGSKDIVRLTPNPDGSLKSNYISTISPNDRTGLRAPTGKLPDNSVKAIRAANP